MTLQKTNGKSLKKIPTYVKISHSASASSPAFLQTHSFSYLGDKKSCTQSEQRALRKIINQNNHKTYHQTPIHHDFTYQNFVIATSLNRDF